MSKPSKLLLSIVLALAGTALILGFTSQLSFYQTSIYMFFILLIYGWWVYIPYAYVFILVIKKLNTVSWFSSMFIGALISATVVSILIIASGNTMFFPSFSGHKGLDIMIFSAGGALFGLLYHFFISRKAKTSTSL